MVRRLLPCVLMMTLLLTGCGAGLGGEESPENLAARIRTEYLALPGWDASAEITADYGDKVYDFTVEASWKREGETVLIITAPELVAGITARLKDGVGYLEYDGASLSTGPLTEEGLSPMGAIPYLMAELTEGYMAKAEYEEEGTVLRVLCRDPEAAVGAGTECVLRFDVSSHALLGAELYRDGVCVLTAKISDFTKEMTDSDTRDHADLGGDPPGEPEA